jgi:hypothetical protein
MKNHGAYQVLPRKLNGSAGAKIKFAGIKIEYNRQPNKSIYDQFKKLQKFLSFPDLIVALMGIVYHK